MIGFTSSSTFMLWLNCNQELGRSYGMTDSSAIQSFYALGTATAILATTFLIKKRSERNQCPDPVSGDFYCDAGSVLPDSGTMDLSGGRICDWLCRRRRSPSAGNIHTAEFFPENKGTATSMVMIASSIANYTIISLASYITKVGGASAPRMILLLNMGVTVVGILLALYVKKNRDK